MRRERDAPRVRRRAISRWRTLARASIKFGEIGAGDQEHESGECEENPQRVFILFTQRRDAGSRGQGSEMK